jgi:hypothetical protein
LSDVASSLAAAPPAEPRGPSMLDRIASSSCSSTGGTVGASAAAASGTLKKKAVRPGGGLASAAAASSALPRASVVRSAFDRGELHAELPGEFVGWAGDWVSELADDALDVPLPHFAEPSDSHPTARTCLVLTCSVPADSAQFAVNICPLLHGGGDDVWLHFNPRQFERGGSLVVDYKVQTPSPRRRKKKEVLHSSK